MKPVPMRFRGVSWRHNPREISFESDRRVTERATPFCGNAVQVTGRRGMVIRGEGELFGTDCVAQFQRLLRLFRQGGSGVLAIEGIKPVYAVFESLTLLGKPRADVLTYRFVFRELTEKSGGDPKEVTAAANETLWDISYRSGVDIDTLVRLNPHIRRPDILTAGEAVRLC